jgi:hypothetical protein
MQEGIWLTEKPEFNKECIFATRQEWGGFYEYNIWMIERIDGEDGWYWGLLTGDGDEWGAIEDLKADAYFIIPKN